MRICGIYWGANDAPWQGMAAQWTSNYFYIIFYTYIHYFNIIMNVMPMGAPMGHHGMPWQGMGTQWEPNGAPWQGMGRNNIPNRHQIVSILFSYSNPMGRHGKEWELNGAP
jgi:hypothetical protein